MGAHTYNPSICEAEEEEKKLEVNVGCVVASKSSQDAQEEPACIPVLAGTCPPLSLVCFLACLYLIIVDSVDIGRSMTTPLLTELIQLDLFMLAGLQLR